MILNPENRKKLQAYVSNLTYVKGQKVTEYYQISEAEQNLMGQVAKVEGVIKNLGFKEELVALLPSSDTHNSMLMAAASVIEEAKNPNTTGLSVKTTEMVNLIIMEASDEVYTTLVLGGLFIEKNKADSITDDMLSALFADKPTGMITIMEEALKELEDMMKTPNMSPEELKEIKDLYNEGVEKLRVAKSYLTTSNVPPVKDIIQWD